MDKRTNERLGRLAATAKASQERWRTDIQVRDDAIVEADAAGYGLREIARACDLTAQHVQRVIVNRARELDNDDAGSD